MSRHLKTYPAPRFWPIKIKEREFVIRPNAGPHKMVNSMPLGLVLRDVLGYAKTVSEAKRLLAEGKVLVDGKVKTDYKLPIGLMDVIYLKPADAYYRVLPNSVNKLALMKITAEEAGFKLAKVAGKRLLKEKKMQLNLHDGHCVSVDISDPFNVDIPYRLMDTVKVSLPDGQIQAHIPLEVGAYVSIIGGTKIGKFGTVKDLPATRSPNKLATITIGDSDTTVTLKYLFPIGKGSPIININGEVT